MKTPPVNLRLALSLAVPTFAAVLGLLWLFLRKKDEHDKTTDSGKPASTSDLKDPVTECVNFSETLTSDSETVDRKFGDGSGETLAGEKISLLSSVTGKQEGDSGPIAMNCVTWVGLNQEVSLTTSSSPASSIHNSSLANPPLSQEETSCSQNVSEEPEPSYCQNVDVKQESSSSEDVLNVEQETNNTEYEAEHGPDNVSFSVSEEQLKQDDAAIVRAQVGPMLSAQPEWGWPVACSKSAPASATDDRQGVPVEEPIVASTDDAQVSKDQVNMVTSQAEVITSQAEVNTSHAEVSTSQAQASDQLIRVQSENTRLDQNSEGNKETEPSLDIRQAETENVQANNKIYSSIEPVFVEKLVPLKMINQKSDEIVLPMSDEVHSSSQDINLTQPVNDLSDPLPCKATVDKAELNVDTIQLEHAEVADVLLSDGVGPSESKMVAAKKTVSNSFDQMEDQMEKGQGDGPETLHNNLPPSETLHANLGGNTDLPQEEVTLVQSKSKDSKQTRDINLVAEQLNSESISSDKKESDSKPDQQENISQSAAVATKSPVKSNCKSDSTTINNSSQLLSVSASIETFSVQPSAANKVDNEHLKSKNEISSTPESSVDASKDPVKSTSESSVDANKDPVRPTAESSVDASKGAVAKNKQPPVKTPSAKAAKPNRDMNKATKDQIRKNEKSSTDSRSPNVSPSGVRRPAPQKQSQGLNVKQQGKKGDKQSSNLSAAKPVKEQVRGESLSSNSSSLPKKRHDTSSSTDASCRPRTESGASDSAKVEDHDRVCHFSGVLDNGGSHSSASPGCDTNSEASNDSGRGGSVGDSLIPLNAGELVRYEFNFPSDLCGRLIGRGGKNIQHIKQQSGATVTLSSNPFTPEFQICHVAGVQAEVETALSMIRKKFPQSHFPQLDMASLMPPAPPTMPVILPELLQLNLPDGVPMGVVVSAVVNAAHVFVQQPAHPTFPALERLSQFMNVCYSDQNAPNLPRPVEGGIICAVESEGQWYRAQIVQVYQESDECDVKYVDYGGYSRVTSNTLKQIRSDFMTLPFQAIECYLANIMPLQGEEFFSDKAAEVLSELTAGKVLEGQVVFRGDDSICYVHLYQQFANTVLQINREMVNRKVVQWTD